MYMGSRLFSRVARYLTLSLASLAASVICTYQRALGSLLGQCKLACACTAYVVSDSVSCRTALWNGPQETGQRLPGHLYELPQENLTFTSTSFHRLYCLLRAVLQTPMTRRHSLLFICSVTELNLAMRTRQNSNSVSGPDSSFKGVTEPASLSASRASVCLHQSANTCKPDCCTSARGSV